MLDFLMLEVKLPVVDRTHPQNNKFSLGVDNKATGESKLNDSPNSEEAYNCMTVSLMFHQMDNFLISADWALLYNI